MADWLVWLILAGILAAGETVTGTFVMLMMAGGAGAGAITAALDGPVAIQIVVALLVTVGLVWLVRPVALRHLTSGATAITGSEALVGKEAIVLSEVTRDGGLVRLNGSEWTARAKDPDQQLPVGTRVSVLQIDGATAVVWHDPLRIS